MSNETSYVTPSNVQIAFPEVRTEGAELAIPEPPRGALATGLTQASLTAESRSRLTCSALLAGDTLVQAQREAAELYPRMRANTQVFMAFGTKALDGVNALIDRLMKEVKPADIPELTAMMKDLNREMRQIRSKYDVSDPKIRERYAKWKGGIGRFFGRARTLMQLLMEDVQSIETQLNKVTKELGGRQNELIRYVGYYDQLYRENEAEIGKVIYVIGVMELIRDLAAAEAAAIVVGDAEQGDREGERKAAIAQFASLMDIKIAEYKGRLFVAWATSPQVRMMRAIDIGLAEKLNELINVTVPTMRATIVQWRMLIRSQDAAKLGAAVASASNDWLQAYAAAGAEVVPAIAQMVETPTLRPDTIEAMARSVQAQADGIVAAMEEGARRRAENDAAMIEAKQVLDASAQKVSDAIVDRIVGNATKPLEIISSVPAK